jgi:hypothetical protein
VEELAGGMGNGGQVFREGDVVVRPSGSSTTGTIAVLHSLAETGFSASIPLNEDSSGRQRFRWIEGDVGVPPFPAWVMTGDALFSAVQLLRAYHEAVAGLQLPNDLRWSDEMADPEGGPIICHNDVCPENVVYRDGHAVALLDFDFAAPGRPLWDLAQMARMWSPLRPPRLVVRGMERLAPFDRLGVIGRAYGLRPSERAEFVDIVIESRRHADNFVRRRLAAREPAFVEAWEPLGGESALDGIFHWLLANREAMLAALN